MIMVVSAAPSRVPATPNLEVIKAAPAEANPAASIWLPLTRGACLASSLKILTLPTEPPGFKERSVPIRRVCVGSFTSGGFVAPQSPPPLECRREGGEGKAENGRDQRRKVLRAFRGDQGLLQERAALPGQGPAGHCGILRFHVRASGHAGRPGGG